MSTVFFDVDTQLDFLYPAGALYVPGAERVVPAIARLNRFAAEHGIPVISTADAHFEDDLEFRQWPHHCVAGTLGQRKAEATLLARSVTIPNPTSPNRPCDLVVEGAAQIVIEKQTVDAFQAPNLERVIERLGGDRFVVYGVVTEVCVHHAVRGLRRLGKAVTVVTDATQTLRAEDSARALAEMQSGGATLATVAQIAV